MHVACAAPVFLATSWTNRVGLDQPYEDRCRLGQLLRQNRGDGMEPGDERDNDEGEGEKGARVDELLEDAAAAKERVALARANGRGGDHAETYLDAPSRMESVCRTKMLVSAEGSTGCM